MDAGLLARPDFRRRTMTYRDGWTGELRTATFAGRCILCGRRTYQDTGGNDPRGPMGDHAASPLDPAEYGATGREVPACFLCLNDTESRYRMALNRARKVGGWRTAEPTVNRCYRCDAPVTLRGADGSPYAGWRHAGPPPADASPWALRAAGEAHEARPSLSVDPACYSRAHHFSGSWCDRCGGWG